MPGEYSNRCNNEDWKDALTLGSVDDYITNGTKKQETLRTIENSKSTIYRCPNDDEDETLTDVPGSILLFL